MHHAWLIAGREGIGKATLAYRLARHVLARPEERDPAGQSLEVGAQTAAARQVRALSHPGLLVLRRPYDVRAKRFAASIPIDEVRRLRSFLGLTGGEGAWRVVIVDCRRRAQHQRRQRAAEIAGGAAARARCSC